MRMALPPTERPGHGYKVDSTAITVEVFMHGAMELSRVKQY